MAMELVTGQAFVINAICPAVASELLFVKVLFAIVMVEQLLVAAPLTKTPKKEPPELTELVFEEKRLLFMLSELNKLPATPLL